MRLEMGMNLDIPDGQAWQFQGYDENGLPRSLNGQLTDAHQVLCSAAEIACKGRQDGGYMIPVHSEIAQGRRIHFEKLVNWYGKNEFIPVYLENNIFYFYLNREAKSAEIRNVTEESSVGKRIWQSCAFVSPMKTLNRDVAPTGDDMEPMGESRADVETGNEEEESRVAEIPTVEMNPKNPMSRAEQEHEDCGHAVYRNWRAACVEGLC